MSSGELTCKSIDNGNASRYIKPRWLDTGTLSTEAFDLREGTPPETYVSHFLAEGQSLDEIFKSAYAAISTRIAKCNKGSIAILDITEALIEVNDEAEPFIKFVEKNLPHCGLVYITPNQQQIQEAKATLCLLAGKNLASAQIFQDQLDSLKKVE
jgi:hypothetical protein